MSAPTVDPAPSWLFEHQIRHRLANGIPIALPPIQEGEADAVQAQRVVQSEWIAALASPLEREIRQPVVLSGVIVRGPLSLKHATFSNDFSITDSVFEADLDLSFATLHKVVSFERTEFQGKVTLSGAKIDCDLEVVGARFLQRLDAGQLVVMNALVADGATFDEVVFDGGQVEGDASFGVGNDAPVTFNGEASFKGWHTSGQAVFSSAQFLGDAKFNLAQIDGGAFFDDNDDADRSSHTLFKEEVDFIGASIKLVLDCAGARFEKSVSFDGLAVTGDAHFERARFGPGASAPETDSPIKIDFPGIHVTGEAKFEKAVFDGDVSFLQSAIDAEALFGGVRFCKNAKFGGVHFFGPVFFRTYQNETGPAEFVGQVSFQGATADQDVHFEGCTFDKDVSFRDAKFNVVYFRDAVTDTIPKDKGGQFPHQGKVDLTGFSYNRIYVAWRELIGLLEPFDNQPYRLMESVFRTMGKEQFAGEVYLAQRKRSLAYNYKHRDLWLRAVLDTLFYLLFRFGVRPVRLFVITAALLVVYAFVFSQPGAVTPKKDSGHQYGTKLTCVEGLEVSFNTFMPIDVPVGAGWLPTEKTAFFQPLTFAGLATILKLTGWLFVPLGTAVFGGLLRR